VRCLRLHDLYVEDPDDLNSAIIMLNSTLMACAAAGVLEQLELSGSQPICVAGWAPALTQLRSLTIDCPAGSTVVYLDYSLSDLHQLTQLRVHCERLILGEGVQLPPNVEQLSLMDEVGVALPQ